MLRFRSFQALLVLALLCNSASNPVLGSPVMANCVEPPPGLVSWWPGDGNADDIYGTSSGTLQNGATFAAGKVGQAFSFDGVDAFVNVPNSAPLANIRSAITVDMWVNRLPQPFGGYVFSRRDPLVSESFSIGVADNGALSVVIRTTTTPYVPELASRASLFCSQPGVITLGQFHHIAVTADTATTGLVKAYVDGQEISLPYTYGPATLSGLLWSVSNLFIGQRQSSNTWEGAAGGRHYRGLIDEVEVYNRVLSANEIQAIFSAGSAGKCRCRAPFCYSISGHVANDSGDPMPNVTVSTGPYNSAITTASGVYTITGLITGTYTITPTLDGYRFAPITRTVTVPPNATGQDFTGTRKAAWTLMFYLDGDNNLDGTYPPIFNQLEAAANNGNVQVVAVWDRLGTNDSAYYDIQYDTDLNNLATYTATLNYWPKGELNMGAPGTLVDFMNWASTNYPAQHCALILSNHGTGLGGGMVDDTSDGDLLTVSEIGAALASATLTGTHKVDVLYMDACLMGMLEDAYQVRDYVDYYVASENIQWAYSTPYFRYISGITATTTPAQVAALFTTSYADVGDANSDPYTMSAADVARLSNLITATNSLAQLLNTQMVTSAITLTTILHTVQRFEMNGDDVINSSDDYIDLYDFARLVKLNFSESSVQTAAQTVTDAVNSYITTERHRTGTTAEGTTWNLDNSHGVSVFFPSTASSFYNADNYDFATGAVWPHAASSLLNNGQTTIAWGPMLVSYFQTTQPGGPDDSTPPQPLPRRQAFRVYLPIIIKR